MDIDGVWAELGFPQYARFAGHRFFPTTDPELSRLCVKAYNDFVLEEWTATNAQRLIPLTIIPWWDIDAAIEETYRTASLGSRAIAFSENPTVLGEPSIHTDHWDPLWHAVAEVGLPLCMHIGSSSKQITSSDDAPVQVSWTATGMNSLLAFADWLWSGVFDRFPAMRIALSPKEAPGGFRTRWSAPKSSSKAMPRIDGSVRILAVPYPSAVHTRSTASTFSSASSLTTSRCRKST